MNSERQQWLDMLIRIASPVLSNMSEGRLHNVMNIETGPTWDNRNLEIGYFECFARLMTGMSPWLSLIDKEINEESILRDKFLAMSLKCYKNAVDNENPDRLLFEGHPQVLVETAYIAESFLKGYDVIWNSLDAETQNRYIDIFINQRKVTPYYNNWILFSAVIETFLNKAIGEGDNFRIIEALRTMDSWYVGDGWYSDGSYFAFDYYNSFVIHPMLLECLSEIDKVNLDKRLMNGMNYNKALRRMQRFSTIIERLISPEGTFPVFGRSITYRSAFLQPLAYLAWKKNLPTSLHAGQVRCAMSAVLNNLFSGNQNFSDEGFLLLGYNGHQPEISNTYTNSGSLYLATTAFLPLGLPQEDFFWTSPKEDWTSKKAWTGQTFYIDHSYTESNMGLKAMIKDRLKEKFRKRN